MEKVTHLLLVTDASKKGCEVVKTIKKVADELVMYEKVGVIANRLPDKSVTEYMNLGDLEIVSVISNDDKLAKYDIMGQNIFELPDDCEIVKGAETALKNIKII